MSMRKGHMMELIQRLIHDEAIEQLKMKKAASPHDAPDMSDDELDLMLFHGGMEPMNESFDGTAKIGTSDITEFENQMHAIISNVPNAILSFDKQPNGHSILLKNGGQSVDVVASGKIAFGNEGNITWMFSIPNGLRLSTEGLQITQENRDIVTNMFDYYNTWQKDWRQKLLAPDQGASSEEQENPGGNQTPGMDMGAQEAPQPEAPSGSAPATSALATAA